MHASRFMEFWPPLPEQKIKLVLIIMPPIDKELFDQFYQWKAIRWSTLWVPDPHVKARSSKIKIMTDGRSVDGISGNFS